MKKYLLIYGNYADDTFSLTLAKKLEEGLNKNNNYAELINLKDVNFNPILKKDSILEDDLKIIQNKMLNSDHIIFVYPLWWGFIPAILKGFLDKTLSEGFAYKYENEQRILPMQGKMISVFSTSGSPASVIKDIYGDLDFKIFEKIIAGFLGVNIKYMHRIGNVFHLDEKQREEEINLALLRLKGE